MQVVAGSESNESSAKRSKSDDGSKIEKDNGDAKSKDSSKTAAEAPKDYIHVRARRGQATDAHSLAERVCVYSSFFDIRLCLNLLFYEYLSSYLILTL